MWVRHGEDWEVDEVIVTDTGHTNHDCEWRATTLDGEKGTPQKLGGWSQKEVPSIPYNSCLQGIWPIYPACGHHTQFNH